MTIIASFSYHAERSRHLAAAVRRAEALADRNGIDIWLINQTHPLARYHRTVTEWMVWHAEAAEWLCPAAPDDEEDDGEDEADIADPSYRQGRRG